MGILSKNPKVEIHLGDCLETMKSIPDKSIDLILTDPPYGINFCSSRTNRKEKLINDSINAWQLMLPEMFIQFKRVLTDTGCFCCCCGGGGKTPVTAIFTMEAIKYFHLIQTLVWKKFIGMGWKYRPAYENIVVLSKSADNYNFYDTSKKCANVIEGINQDIPQYNADKRGGYDEHPTQKPIALMKHLLLIHSQPNHTVLDPFMGSGTTALACIDLDCNFVGIEIEPKYYEIAQMRIKKELSQRKMLYI